MKKTLLMLGLSLSLTACSLTGGDDKEPTKPSKKSQRQSLKMQDKATASKQVGKRRAARKSVVSDSAKKRLSQMQQDAKKVSQKTTQSKQTLASSTLKKSPQSKPSFKNNRVTSTVTKPVTKAVAKSPVVTSPVAKPQGVQANYEPVRTDPRPLDRHAKNILNALTSGGYARLVKDIHPVKGVRFSMYAFIDPRLDKTFSRTEFRKSARNKKLAFTWGDREDTGMPLVMSVPDYLSQWMNVKQFAGVTGTPNRSQTQSGIVDTLKDVYPDSEFVEYYQPKNQKDWRAMRLVFETYKGKRYLVGVVSDRWVE